MVGLVKKFYLLLSHHDDDGDDGDFAGACRRRYTDRGRGDDPVRGSQYWAGWFMIASILSILGRLVFWVEIWSPFTHSRRTINKKLLS